jgi:hypothetical protein
LLFAAETANNNACIILFSTVMGVDMKRFPLLLTVVFCTILLGACRTAPVYNVGHAPVATGSGHANMREVRQAILKAGSGLGWRMRLRKPGHIVGTLALRSHLAVVDIVYNTQAYSIQYNRSRNLKYDGKHIHKNYNGWIRNLRNHIDANLAVD